MAYNPAFDGLRALAVCLVIFFHAGLLHLHGGVIGVDIFFVLSGFLITSVLCNELLTTGEISFRRFYLRRASRLLPALFVIVAIFLAINGRSGVTAAMAASFYYMNVLCATDPSITLSAIAHTWSLATEEQFYFVWPLLFLCLAKRFVHNAGTLALVMTILSALLRVVLTIKGAPPARVYYAPDTHCDGIFLGCFVALRPIDHPRLAAMWPLPILLIVVSALFGDWPSRMMAFVGFAVANVSTAWIIIALSAQVGSLRFQLPVTGLCGADFLRNVLVALFSFHQPQGRG